MASDHLKQDERWALYTRRGGRLLRVYSDMLHKPTLCKHDARYYTVRRVRIVPVEESEDGK